MGAIPPPGLSQIELTGTWSRLSWVLLCVLVVAFIAAIVITIMATEKAEIIIVEGKFGRVEYIPDGGFFGGPARTVICLMDGRTVILYGHENILYKRGEWVVFRVRK